MAPPADIIEHVRLDLHPAVTTLEEKLRLVHADGGGQIDLASLAALVPFLEGGPPPFEGRGPLVITPNGTDQGGFSNEGDLLHLPLGGGIHFVVPPAVNGVYLLQPGEGFSLRFDSVPSLRLAGAITQDFARIHRASNGFLVEFTAPPYRRFLTLLPPPPVGPA